MHQKLLNLLGQVTEEEQRILDGQTGIEKRLYASGEEFTIDYTKLLETGQLITVRTHTRFAHFPLHRHNYVEVMYVCQGSVTHIINHKRLVVRQGELLFLNQYTKHEILPAGREDIAINFVILPEFLDVASEMIGRNNVLADFIVNTLRKDSLRGEYLYFRVSDVLQIQNLIENMIYSLVALKWHAVDSVELQTLNRINQTTMGLVFMYLLEVAPKAETMAPDQYENMIFMTSLNYIEQNYRTATLTELSEGLHLPDHGLSRMIKKTSGANFKELLQRKRLNHAVQLLCDTDLTINDIIDAVGYDNHSYFHRIFRERFHMTPREFRELHRGDAQIHL
ncbi:MAG: AraC family transcriptional regulator [Eubacterium sp.]|nr:AraC family transcriptional regulator [Eubacterium sp.]